MFIVEQNALGVGGHYFAYTACVAQAAIAEGVEPVILQNTRQKTDWGIPGALVISAFTRNWGEAERAGNTGWGPGDIVYELLAATSSAPPTAGDHVLFHTLGQTELRSVLSYLARIPPSDHIPTYHVLLRYDPVDLGPTILALEPVLAHIREARHLRRAVRFHTDTERLTRTYAQITRLPFSTLPIPFGQGDLRRSIADETPRAADAPITFVYLGDARIEKNYHHIPAAVTQLWDRYVRSGKVRFVLQSNFNTEGGEPGQLAAVQRLGQFPEERVRLIPEPMASTRYYAELSNADVVLVPYSAERYRERSSGVLVEAMAAGKPVITSAGSWMESFVSDDHAVLFDDPTRLAEAMETIIVDYERYRTGALNIREAMLEWSSGGNFVRHLLKAEAPASDDRRPNALVIMNGDAMVLQNGSSQIVRSQFGYLMAAGFRVTGLFLTKTREASNETIEAFTGALLEAIGDIHMDECHIAAPGRLAADVMAQSMARSREEESISAERDLAAYYDYNATTLRALRRHAPDVIVLNYITTIGVVDALGLEDVPLICEMHDIQSFQKAIYGRRAVSAGDLDLELELLARCDHLISLNETEAELVRERLPGVPCHTTGVFSAARPSTYADLAGCKDVEELVSSTRPQRPALRHDQSWQQGDVAAPPHRIAFQRVDLLFVSSSHIANVSGLHWFLDTVFIPFLAPLGIRMVVAGSIYDHGGWPRLDGLLFTGQIEDLAPLYAAARIVVLPITEGAGSAVKAFEAMRYARPIVATPMALRGISETIDGVLVASQPAQFAEQVLRLIRSPALRAECRAKIAAVADRLLDQRRYRTVMNEVVARLLGPQAPCAPVEDAVPLRASDVELDSETIAINRLVRGLLDDEELDFEQLRLLAACDPHQLRLQLDEIVDALLIGRTAPILRSEPRVRDRLQVMCSRFPGFAQAVAPLLQRAIRHAGAELGGIPPAVTLFHHRQRPVSLITIGKSAPTVDLDGTALRADIAINRTDRKVAVHDVPAAPDTQYDFVARDIRFGDGGAPPAVLLTDTIEIGAPILTAGMPLVPDQAEGAWLFLSVDRPRLLNLPRLGGISGAALVIDIFFADDFGVDCTLTAHCLGNEVAPSIAIAEARLVRRIVLDNAIDRAPFGSLPLSLRVCEEFEACTGAAVEKVRLTLIAGADVSEAMATLDELAALSGGLTAQGTVTPILLAQLRVLLAQMALGAPIPVNGARILRDMARLPGGQAALHAAVHQLSSKPNQAADERNGRIIDAALFPSEVVVADGPGIVAAPSVALRVAATFAMPDRDIGCSIGGVPASPDSMAPDRALCWHAAAGSRQWHRPIRWQTADQEPLTPATARAIIAFPANATSAAGSEQVAADNVYGIERTASGNHFCWTGPGTTSTFLLPIAITAPGELRLTVLTLGNNAPEDIDIRVNGVATQIAVIAGTDGAAPQIRAMLTAQDGPATTLVEIEHRRLFQPSGTDRRWLGICLLGIEIELDIMDTISSASVRTSAGPAL